MILNTLLLTLSLLAAPPQTFSVQQYTAESETASLYVLQETPSSTPGIAILDHNSLSLYQDASTNPIITHTIPSNTLFFDYIDSNRNGIPELFILTPTDLHYYPDTNNDKVKQLFTITPPLPWSVKQPFLHPLIFPYNDTHLVAIPDRDSITLRNFEGKVISTLPKIVSNTHSLFSISIEPNQLGSKGAFEFRVDTLITTPINIPQELRPITASNSFSPVSQRQLRDSEHLEFEQWPSFPLNPKADIPTKVVYASYPPEHIHTVIRIKKKLPRNISGTPDPYRYSPKRIYPGMIGISESGLPDFNNDGFHDLLLWKIPTPGKSISTLIQSVQLQTWPLECSIHLYNPEKELYEARPTARIKTTIALEYILTRQNESPLHNLSFKDMNQDGISDITFSQTPNGISSWIVDDTLNSTPEFTSKFNDPISLITLDTSDNTANNSSILLRGKHSIYRINLAQKTDH